MSLSGMTVMYGVGDSGQEEWNPPLCPHGLRREWCTMCNLGAQPLPVFQPVFTLPATAPATVTITPTPTHLSKAEALKAELMARRGALVAELADVDAALALYVDAPGGETLGGGVKS